MNLSVGVDCRLGGRVPQGSKNNPRDPGGRRKTVADQQLHGNRNHTGSGTLTVNHTGFIGKAPQINCRKFTGVGCSGAAADNLDFAEKCAFAYDLLSDEDGHASLSQGAIAAPGEGYPLRVTYLFGAAGAIEQVFPQADPATHPREVLQPLRQVGGGWSGKP